MNIQVFGDKSLVTSATFFRLESCWELLINTRDTFVEYRVGITTTVFDLLPVEIEISNILIAVDIAKTTLVVVIPGKDLNILHPILHHQERDQITVVALNAASASQYTEMCRYE